MAAKLRRRDVGNCSTTSSVRPHLSRCLLLRGAAVEATQSETSFYRVGETPNWLLNKRYFVKSGKVCSQSTAGETIEYFEYERLCKPSLFTTKLRLHVFCLNERLFDNSLKPIPALRKIFLNKNLKH